MNLGVNIAGVEFKNPITVCSGTFGAGEEYSEFIDISKLGAITTKGIADKPWPGNSTPRVVEVRGGMLNAIGLQGPGVEVFCERELTRLSNVDTKVIVNVCGHTNEEYLNVVRRLQSEKRVDMLEINISCPNVKEGGIAFGTNPAKIEEITKLIKAEAAQPVCMKLSPNVADIAACAKAAEAGGADAISLINTLTGMKIDVERQSLVLANGTGGMSGPAVHPIAVRMVYQCSKAVNIPIIGMGGVETAADAIELMLAGATMVAVGTANFYNPYATVEIIDGIKDYMNRHKVEDVNDLIGLVSKK